MTPTVHGPRSPGACDRCGAQGLRHLVVEDYGDGLPSHSLLCPRCTPEVPPMTLHPDTGPCLNRAADLLEEEGWTQGQVRAKRKLCAEEAIRQAAVQQVTGSEERLTLAAHAAVAVCRDLKVSDLARWQDYPTRTRRHVVEALRKTALSLNGASMQKYVVHDGPSSQPASVRQPASVAQVPHVAMVDGGPPVPTTELGVTDRLITLEMAVTTMAGAIDASIQRMAQLVSTALTEQRHRIDQVDEKVTTFARATAEDMATLAARLDNADAEKSTLERRLSALEAALGERTVAEAEQILRDGR